MLAKISRKAFELDIWLHERVGRPYIAILGWSLALSILDSLRELGHTLGTAASGSGSQIKLLLVLIFQGALLVNQLAQWHERRKGRGRGGAEPSAPGTSE